MISLVPNQSKQLKSVPNAGGNKITSNHCVDIGINITSKQLKPKWKEIVRRAVDSGVNEILLTGTSIKSSLESLEIARTWMDETGGKNLFCTVGVHPHDAKFFDSKTTINEMKSMLNDPLAVAVGECGLDYNRNFSPKQKQLECFRAQLKLAIELQFPIFLHEREAFNDTIKVFDEFKDLSLPPVVVHCFTGTLQEAQAYIERGFFIGFTGTICMKQRGAPLREIIPKLPLERLMVETDAPWMGFLKTRRSSEPTDVILVAEEMAKAIGVPPEVVRQITTKTAKTFFRLGSDAILVDMEPTIQSKRSFVGSTTRVVGGARLPVGMSADMAGTGAGQKSKNSLRKERQREAKKKRETDKATVAAAAVASTAADPEAVDPAKRVRKLKKTLKQIAELKTKDLLCLNDDQKRKIAAEEAITKELAELGL